MREEQADKLVKEILELSDKIEDDNPVKVQRARLQVDSRKWLAARLAPNIQCSSDEGEGFIDVRSAPEAAGGTPQEGNENLVRGR